MSSPYPILDIDKLGVWVQSLGDPLEIKYIAVEAVHSMPRDGVVSAFTFGWGTGAISTYFQVSLPAAKLIFIPPKDWQKLLSDRKDRLKESNPHLSSKEINKLASLERVREKYPNVSLRKSSRATTDSDGIADAINIADYVCRM
jgi:hypothetical protein